MIHCDSGNPDMRQRGPNFAGSHADCCLEDSAQDVRVVVFIAQGLDLVVSNSRQN